MSIVIEGRSKNKLPAPCCTDLEPQSVGLSASCCFIEAERSQTAEILARYFEIGCLKPVSKVSVTESGEREETWD